MTTPSTNLGASSIQTEFGGTDPIALSEYYRGAGGGYVPSTQATSSIDGSPIAASGQIRFGEFRNLTKITSGVNTFSYTVPTSYNSNGANSAFIALFANGQTQGTYNAQYTNTSMADTGPNWFSPTTAGISSSYYASWAITSTNGGTISGTWPQNSWHLINTFWNVTAAVSGQPAGVTWTTVITIQFSPNASGFPVVGTGTVTLTNTNYAGPVPNWSDFSSNVSPSTAGTRSTALTLQATGGTLVNNNTNSNNYAGPAWYQPSCTAAVGGSYWVYATHTTGNAAIWSGTFNTWYQISTSGTGWSCTNGQSTNTAFSNTITVKISATNNGPILSTGTVNMYVGTGTVTPITPS